MIINKLTTKQKLTIMEKFTIKISFTDGSETIAHVECEEYCDVRQIARGWILTSSLIVKATIYNDDGKILTTYIR